MKGPFLQQLEASGLKMEMDPEVAIQLLLNSIGVGLMLMIVTIVTNVGTRKKKSARSESGSDPAAGSLATVPVVGGAPSGVSAFAGSAVPAGHAPTHPPGQPAEKEPGLKDTILSCANVLFLAFAMCGVIILVNNDLARAFALGAAIALVRFRIKLNAKTLGSAMLFGIVTGMACGIGQTILAWGIAGAYRLMQVVLIGVLKLIPDEKKAAAGASKPRPVNSAQPSTSVMPGPLTAAHGVD